MNAYELAMSDGTTRKVNADHYRSWSDFVIFYEKKHQRRFFAGERRVALFSSDKIVSIERAAT